MRTELVAHGGVGMPIGQNKLEQNAIGFTSRMTMLKGKQDSGKFPQKHSVVLISCRYYSAYLFLLLSTFDFIWYNVLAGLLLIIQFIFI